MTRLLATGGNRHPARVGNGSDGSIEKINIIHIHIKRSVDTSGELPLLNSTRMDVLLFATLVLVAGKIGVMMRMSFLTPY
jgi:hypothetical protein